MTTRTLLQPPEYLRKNGRSALPKMISLRGLLAGVGFQDPQHFCNRLGVLMRAVAGRDDAFALRTTGTVQPQFRTQIAQLIADANSFLAIG